MNSLTKRLLALGVSATVATAGGYLVAPWEGKSNKAYKDIVGISTICYGQTKNVKMGDYRTDEECEKDLADELTHYNQRMLHYVKVPLEDYEEVAYTSFIWNLGETNWRNSTLLKKLNAGDHPAACMQLLRWNTAGGKVIKGLDNRRKDEYKVCTGNHAEINLALLALENEGYGSIDIEVGEPDAQEPHQIDSETLEIVTEGVGEGDSKESLTEPLKPVDIDDITSKVEYSNVCSFKFLGVCWKK